MNVIYLREWLLQKIRMSESCNIIVYTKRYIYKECKYKEKGVVRIQRGRGNAKWVWWKLNNALEEVNELPADWMGILKSDIENAGRSILDSCMEISELEKSQSKNKMKFKY